MYQVTVSRQGNIVEKVGVLAASALEAIKQVEAGYKPVRMQLSTKNGDFTTVSWTGCEFQARRVAA